MTAKIIITANETIVCPKCSHHFSLDQGITRQTIERYESEFEQVFAAQRKEMEIAISNEAERKANKTFSDQITKLQEQLGDTQKAEKEARALITKTQADTKVKAQLEFAQEKQALADELAEKEVKLKQFRDQELDLRKQKKQLEEDQANMQLALQRKLDEERVLLTAQIGQKEAERFSMIEAEYRKKIEDAQKANEDLRRKLDQGSQQLQGEVQELELESLLRARFPQDIIEPVPKGEYGGDALQRVIGQIGQPCGTILWESKRTKNWSDGWLSKLREDQRAAKAEIAIIVSQALPKNLETFDLIDGIWITSPRSAIAVALVLRHSLIELAAARQASEGQQTKMELVYQYLTGPRFRQRVQAIVEKFTDMHDDLDRERKAMTRLWAKREEQIRGVIDATAGMYGDLQGIAGKTLQEIEGLSLVALPSPREKK